MSVRTSVALAAAGSLLLATPALADRAGDAPIKAPQNLTTHHIAFTLPGGPWKQQVGGLAGTPALGRYALDVKLADGTVCTLTATVVGNTSAHRFVAHGDQVNLRPFSRFTELLHIRTRGGHGGVGWWGGSMPNFDAAAGGSQRLPADLATKARPYLNYNVRITHAAPRKDDPCAARARKTGAKVAYEIGGTMHIEPGPPVAAPPFATA